MSERTKPSVLGQQYGGEHYKGRGIEPVEYIHANKMDFFQGNIVKLITRFREKGGATDLQKAIHYSQMLLEMDYGVKTTFTVEASE